MSAVYFGFNAPFFGGKQNVLSRQEDDQLIKNDILQLLNTVPGEREMRPLFGVNLRNYIFDPLDDFGIVSLEQEIRSKIEQYEPRVIIQLLTLTPDPANNKLTINLKCGLKLNPRKVLEIRQTIIGNING